MRVDLGEVVGGDDSGEGDEPGEDDGEDGDNPSGTASMLSRKKGLLAHSSARWTTNSRWSEPTSTRRRALTS